MNELRGWISVKFLLVCLIVGTSFAVDAAECFKSNEDGILLMCEYLYSIKVKVKSNPNSGCLRLQRQELGGVWCVNCHAGADPDQLRRK